MLNIIRSIDLTSPLYRRAQPGDAIVSVNGKEIRDVLDYKYHSYDTKLKVVLRRPDATEYTVNVRKSEGGDLGLEFETYLMDAPRSCANRCIFCFIDQLPKGMRPTMYFKDDDARLSFLMGNYITLTNLSAREIDRIIELHISPVNISVHTTNPQLRCMMLRNPHAGESIAVMQRLAEAGISMNCQIVCCPGINDGEELDRTMADLKQLYPGVNSVSVVPLGVTKYREGLYPLTPFTAESAAELIDRVESFSNRCLAELGTRLFFCGDELYIKAGRELPPDTYYEEHTQLENGVGMLRLLETEFLSALKLSDEPDGVPFIIATGTAAAPFFKNLLCLAGQKYDKLNGEVIAVENEFFGSSVTVAGLLTGQDMLAALKGRAEGKRVFISRNMLRRDELDFLDDVTLRQLSEQINAPVYPVEQDGFELWDAISGAALPCAGEPEKGEDTQYYKYN